MDRRDFLRSSALAVGVTALGPAFWSNAYGATAKPGRGPYGPLLAADANGVMLPKGFSSRILATSGKAVGKSGYLWHTAPDGGAVFPQPDGGWVYTSNSETTAASGGGAGALRFDRKGAVVDAYRILSDTSNNCAGGPTPWGTWLSCEEVPTGQVWECDVTKPGQGVVRPALGRFSHEAVAIDHGRKTLYLTEDQGDSRFYRFIPTSYPDLSAGRLEALAATAEGAVTWIAVPLAELPQPAQTPLRPAGSMAFDGGEGVWYDADHVYFTTKGDNVVWDLDVKAQRLSKVYDAAALGDGAPLTGVDNIIVSQSGDIFVGEDGGNLEVVLITPDRVVTPVVRLMGHDASEITGPAFSPDGKRLYFSSQRGVGATATGITFEVSGPFRTARAGAAAPARPAAPPRPAAPVPGTGAVAQPPVPAVAQLPTTGTAPALAATGAVLAGAAALATRRSTRADS